MSGREEDEVGSTLGWELRAKARCAEAHALLPLFRAAIDSLTTETYTE